MNDAQARELLPSLALDLLEPRQAAALRSYLASHPALAQEFAAMQTAFTRLGGGSLTPPAEVWHALEQALARDAATPAAARVATPLAAPRWRERRPAGGRDRTPSEDLRFGQAAVVLGWLSADHLARALDYQRQHAPHLRLGELLLDKGLLTRAQVEELLARQEAAARSPQRVVAPASLAVPASAPDPVPPRGQERASAASAEPGDPWLGQRIGGAVLRQRLGAGAMGLVYLARQDALQRDVVVKLLPPESAANPRTVERFFREARAAARLEHPHVVGVQDVGTTPEGQHYIVMQYVEGQDLEQRLREQGRQEETVALQLALQIARGLAAAHAVGVIHRDVKAENVLVSRSGVVKVSDFGLAKDLNSELKLTADGALIGTPLYMAPEIGRVREIDARVDVYSLGVTLYYLVTGVQPFRGFSALDILSARAHERLAPPEQHLPSIDPGLRTVLARALAKDRDQRYGSMEELIEDLERLLRGQAPLRPAPADGPWPPALAPAPTRPSPALLLGLVLAAGALVAGAWALWRLLGS